MADAQSSPDLVGKECNEYVREFLKDNELAGPQRKFFIQGIADLERAVAYVTGRETVLPTATKAFEALRSIGPNFWGMVPEDHDTSLLTDEGIEPIGSVDELRGVWEAFAGKHGGTQTHLKPVAAWLKSSLSQIDEMDMEFNQPNKGFKALRKAHVERSTIPCGYGGPEPGSNESIYKRVGYGIEFDSWAAFAAGWAMDLRRRVFFIGALVRHKLLDGSLQLAQGVPPQPARINIEEMNIPKGISNHAVELLYMKVLPGMEGKFTAPEFASKSEEIVSRPTKDNEGDRSGYSTRTCRLFLDLLVGNRLACSNRQSKRKSDRIQYWVD